MPLAHYTGGQTYFQHHDWLGTERVTTAYNGSVAGTYISLPFGDGYSASGSDTDAYHFAGLDQDYTTTGHAQFRQYANLTGRWLSPDVYSGSYDFSNPQSFNRYSYVLNDPLSLTDRLGQECVWDDGSFDAADDPNTGSAKQCSGQGGTWVDPSLFESVEGNQAGSWSGQGSSQMQFDWLTPSSTTSADISATPTLADASAFYQMWLSGAGPASIAYGPNDGATQQLAQTPTARGLQQKYTNAGCPSSAIYPSGHIGPWLHGYGTLNATEMQVGGFTESITTSGGTTTFAITNTAGQASYSGATTSQTLARLNPFNRNGTSDNPFGPNGPRHNINQTFSWTEPNPCGH